MSDPDVYYDENALTAHAFKVNSKTAGQRLDHYLATQLNAFSRTYLQKLVKSGRVTVNRKPAKSGHVVEDGDAVDVAVPAIRKVELIAQDIKFDVIYEDENLLAINKPRGLIIHPGTGRIDGTLANGLMHYFNKAALTEDPLRPGIVHRIDKDTTGVLLVGKNTATHGALQEQFQARTVHKEYLTFVDGEPRMDQGVVDLAIGRDPKMPTLRTIITEEKGGKPSVTGYEVLERFDGYAFVKCMPRTGRTHQIRVHMKAIKHPLLIDASYGRRTRVTLSDLTGRPATADDPVIMDRLTLHAFRIHFVHPQRQENMTLEAPLPDDMRRLLEALRKYRPRRAAKK